MLYSCEDVGIFISNCSCEAKLNNQEQLHLVQKFCQNKQNCQIDVSRQFFGNSQCPGTDDAEMNLWLSYSCDGGTDLTRIYKPKCTTTTSCKCGVKKSSRNNLEIVGGPESTVICYITYFSVFCTIYIFSLGNGHGLLSTSTRGWVKICAVGHW